MVYIAYDRTELLRHNLHASGDNSVRTHLGFCGKSTIKYSASKRCSLKTIGSYNQWLVSKTLWRNEPTFMRTRIALEFPYLSRIICLVASRDYANRRVGSVNVFEGYVTSAFCLRVDAKVWFGHHAIIHLVLE